MRSCLPLLSWNWMLEQRAANLNVVFLRDLCREVAFTPHAQVAANEGLEVAVENLVDIANFNTGAQVLGHAVGLKNVAANLRAELDIELGVLQFSADGFLLVEFVLVEARAEELHRPLFILVLAALVLASGNEARWEVSNADGGV